MGWVDETNKGSLVDPHAFRRNVIARKLQRLKGLEAKITMAERKMRTRRLIELGGLMAKAGLDHWSTNTLYGALLSLKAQEHHQAVLNQWTDEGGKAFHKEGTNHDTQAVSVTFPTLIKAPLELRTQLKMMGLSWNKIRQCWEGRVHVSSLEEMIRPYEGHIESIKSLGNCTIVVP